MWESLQSVPIKWQFVLQKHLHGNTHQDNFESIVCWIVFRHDIPKQPLETVKKVWSCKTDKKTNSFGDLGLRWLFYNHTCLKHEPLPSISGVLFYFLLIDSHVCDQKSILPWHHGGKFTICGLTFAIHISIWECDHYSHFDHLDLAILVIFSIPWPGQCARLCELRPAKCPLGTHRLQRRRIVSKVRIHPFPVSWTQSISETWAWWGARYYLVLS